MWTKGSGTNSVNPPVRRWISRITSRWFAQAIGSSICPNMIVDVDLKPSS